MSLFVQRRTDVFSDVLTTGIVTSVNVDTNQSDKLLRLLDTVVIKLEGGTDEDLKVLDEKPNIEQKPEPAKEPLSAAATAIPKLAAVAVTEPVNDGGDANENDEDGGEIKEIDSNTPNETNADEKPVNAEEKASKKRKRTTSGSSSSSSSSTSSSGKFFFRLKFVGEKKIKVLKYFCRFFLSNR